MTKRKKSEAMRPRADHLERERSAAWMALPWLRISDLMERIGLHKPGMGGAAWIVALLDWVEAKLAEPEDRQDSVDLARFRDFEKRLRAAMKIEGTDSLGFIQYVEGWIKNKITRNDMAALVWDMLKRKLGRESLSVADVEMELNRLQEIERTAATFHDCFMVESGTATRPQRLGVEGGADAIAAYCRLTERLDVPGKARNRAEEVDADFREVEADLSESNHGGKVATVSVQSDAAHAFVLQSQGKPSSLVVLMNGRMAVYLNARVEAVKP